jgi:uncharacterized protein YebE (UPF0316 family)
MDASVILTCLIIILARITDVTLDTLRTTSIVQGRRTYSAILGFFEAVIYVSVVAKVLLNLDHRVYVLAYGTGYALGTFFGITIEQRLAFGQQLATLFTRKGMDLAQSLMAAGYRVAEVQGQIHNGEITILYVEVTRKHAARLILDAAAIDAFCFCVVNDVRLSRYAIRQAPPAGKQAAASGLDMPRKEEP